MRWSLAIMAALLVLVVAACGGQPAASSGNGDGGDGGDGGGSSTAPAASQDDGDGGDGGDGDGNVSGSVEDIYDQLIPPNSTETTLTTAGGAIVGGYTTTDNIDSVISFYESAIPDTGMEIFSTTNAQGGTAWLFAESEGSAFGGSVSVFPSGDEVQVLVTVTGE